MAIIKEDNGLISGGRKIAHGFIASSVPSNTLIPTVDDTTGASFTPKKLVFMTIYGGNDTMGGTYDADTSTSSYERYFTNKQNVTIDPPQTSYTGLRSIETGGFKMNDTSNFTNFYYIAEG